MSTTVLLEVKARAGTGDHLVAMFKAILGDTRAYDGCECMDLFESQKMPSETQTGRLSQRIGQLMDAP